MKKSFKTFISALLTVILTFGIGTVAFAQDDNASTTEGSLSIISANVAGLPIPSYFDSEGKVVPQTQKLMGQLLNESGIDIICVQEDFQFHSILSAQMTNYPYTTYTSGGIPAGDGLNIFSKYPIYNVDRVAWEEYNGILSDASDGLTPKGFLKCTVDYNGILIDVYDVHNDADDSDGDISARHVQNEQLTAYINENSADRPVIITGDMNVHMTIQPETGIYEIYVDREGFDDAWTTFCNDGIYYPDGTTDEEHQALVEKFGSVYMWGQWDSVERALYRGNSNVDIEVTDFKYENYNTLAGQALTDHSIMVCEFKVTTTDYVTPDITLEVETKKPFAEHFTYFVKCIFRSLNLLITDLVAKLISGEIKIIK